jgi:hypothetical protein
MKVFTLLSAMLAAFGSAYAQSDCTEYPPPPLTNASIFINWSDPPCNATSCPAGQDIAVRLDAFGVDFSCPIYSFEWNFGDGTTVRTSVPTATHTYRSPGVYTLTVCIARPDGAVTITKSLLVIAAVPTLSFFSAVMLAVTVAAVALFRLR